MSITYIAISTPECRLRLSRRLVLYPRSSRSNRPESPTLSGRFSGFADPCQDRNRYCPNKPRLYWLPVTDPVENTHSREQQPSKKKYHSGLLSSFRKSQRLFSVKSESFPTVFAYSLHARSGKMTFLYSNPSYRIIFTMTQAIAPQLIVQYLMDHPDFFEHHADLLPALKLTSPVIGKAVSIHERQIEVLRSKYRTLELQLSRLVQTAQENRALMGKILDWVQALLKENNPFEMPQAIIDHLNAVFSMPDATLRLWNLREDYADSWFTQGVSEDVRDRVNEMKKPYCGEPTEQTAAVKWLDNADTIRSVALVPLRKTPGGTPFGLLVMGSPDATRFQHEMATDFLTELGKLAGAALDSLLVVG